MKYITNFNPFQDAIAQGATDALIDIDNTLAKARKVRSRFYEIQD